MDNDKLKEINETKRKMDAVKDILENLISAFKDGAFFKVCSRHYAINVDKFETETHNVIKTLILSSYESRLKILQEKFSKL